MNASRRVPLSNLTRAQATQSPNSSPTKGSSAKGPSGLDTPKRSTGNPTPNPSPGSTKRGSPTTQDGNRRMMNHADGTPGSNMSRKSSLADCKQDDLTDPDERPLQDSRGLFHVIEQLAALEATLYSILDGLKSNATHVSYFCREYWGTSASHAQLSLERLSCNERLKRQVQQACVLESLSLGVCSHYCTGVMQGVSVTIRSRLRNLLYYIHENCLVLLDMVCQRWLAENPNLAELEPRQSGHCPENLNLDILVRVKRYRRLRKGEHIMALRQHNEMIANVVRQLCRGAAAKRPPLSGRSAGAPGDRSPGARGTGGNPAPQSNVLSAVNDILSARMPLDRLRASGIRTKMLQFMRFKALLNVDGADPDCPWPAEDPYERYGAEFFAQEGATIWFEPLPPMMPDLEFNPKLPPVASPDTYTLVLDLDETLVHYFEFDGMGNYDIRPGMSEFLHRMSALGYELVIFTAATQDYADWVIDQIDPEGLIIYRLYRQHALPWGPIFVKDLSRLGRDLDRTLIIDNVQENFMLQPHNGIFIVTWYDDPQDTALFGLTPLLEELITTRVRVPDIFEKYQDQIPSWAGFDRYEQYSGAEYSDHLDPLEDEGPPDDLPPPPSMASRGPCQAPPPRPRVDRPGVAVGASGPTPGPASSLPAPAFSSVSGPYQSVMQQSAGVDSAGGFRSEASANGNSPPGSPPLGGAGGSSPVSAAPSYRGHVQSDTNVVLERHHERIMSMAPAPVAMPVGSSPAVSSSHVVAHHPQMAQGGYPQLPRASQAQQARPPAVRQALPMSGQMGPQRALAPGQAIAPSATVASSPGALQRAPGSSATAPVQMLQMRQPAHAFSSVSGPYQPQAALLQPQVAQTPGGAMYGRPGLNPHQAQPPALLRR